MNHDLGAEAGDAEDQDARFMLTPRAVATRALGAEQWADAVLADLGKFARLGLEPGEVGIIVFPADGAPYFDAGEAPEVQPSGNAQPAETGLEGGA